MLVFGIFLRDSVFYLFEEISGEGRIRFESRECITCCDCLEFEKLMVVRLLVAVCLL